MKTLFKVSILSLVGVVALVSAVSASAQYSVRGDVTRAQLVDMIVDAQNVNPKVSQYNSCFLDVRREEFADEVCFAAAQGWLAGYGPEFQPYRMVSVEDAERLVSRAFGVESLYVDFDSPAATKTQVRDFIYRTRSYADGYHLTVTSRVVRATPTPRRTTVAPVKKVRTTQIPDGYSAWTPYSSGFYNAGYYGSQYQYDYDALDRYYPEYNNYSYGYGY